MSTAKYTNFQWVLQIMGRIYKVTLENFTCLESEKFLIWKFWDFNGFYWNDKAKYNHCNQKYKILPSFMVQKFQKIQSRNLFVIYL